MKYLVKSIHSWGFKERKKGSKNFKGYFFANNICTKKIKWKEMNNPIYDNSCDNGDFSHVYIIGHQYFGL
jgi:hypothetical protein